MDPRWGVRFNYGSGKGEMSDVVGDFRLGMQRRSFCCSSQRRPRSVDTSLSVCASGLTWDRVGASQTTCLRLCRPAAHHLKGPSGMVSILAPPAGGKATLLLPEGFVSPPGWFLAAPHAVTVPGCARSKQRAGGRPQWEIFRASHRCPSPVAPSPEALLYLGLHLLCRTVETESAGRRGQNWGASTRPLSASSRFFPFSPPPPSPGRWGCSSSWVRRS